MPAEKGDVRNLTNTPGAAERDPAWSPDGKSIAYFSDESGEYELHVRAQGGRGEVKKFTARRRAVVLLRPDLVARQQEDRLHRQAPEPLVSSTSTAARTRWSTPAPTIDDRRLDPAWSPDSKWLAYTKVLKNHLRAVFLYSLETARSHQVTDGMSDARLPRSTRAASTLLHRQHRHRPGAGRHRHVDHQSPGDAQRLRRRARQDAAVAAGARERRGEGTAEADGQDRGQGGWQKAPKDKPEPPPVVKIDLEDIDQRILALPMPPRNYVGLHRRQGRRAVPPRGPNATVGAMAGGGPAEPDSAPVRSGQAQGREVRGGERPARSCPPTARRCSTASGDKWIGRPARAPRRSPGDGQRSRSTTWRCASIRGPSGSRCTARSGGSSATSSTTRLPRPRT